MIPFIPFLLLVSVSPFQATTALLNNNRITVNCTGSTYAVNSTYQTNLNTLFSSLTANSTSSTYSNATIGTSANRIYGLYVCEGDLSPADCQTCVQSATANITATGSCPGSRQAIIWYDYCMLRYSDANFFGVPDSNGFNMTNPDTSLTITSLVPYQMVSNLVQIAPIRRPMFASNASTGTNSYAMAQCTDDLSSAGCSQCLNTILSNIKVCCTHSNGWRYLSASCSVRERLDRAFSNAEWRLMFQNALVHHFPRFGSDHCPILINLSLIKKKRYHYFMFENMWSEHRDFTNVVQSSWQNNSQCRNKSYMGKIADLKTNLSK